MFKISLDRIENKLVAMHYLSLQMDKSINIIKGKTAESIYTEIMGMGLVARLDHAAYLGSELAKAEIALRTGKEYIQDSQLFKK
jgi:dihydropteroate synthase